MKFVFNATTFIGLSCMLFFMFTYIAEKQWENAMCWAACAGMMIACRYYEWKAEEIEKFNRFLMTQKSQEIVSDGISKIMADALMNAGKNGTDEKER